MAARSIAVWLMICSAAAIAQVRSTQALKGVHTPMTAQRAGLDQSVAVPPATHLASPDTVRVLALMVDFQTNISTLTNGDGHFQLDSTTAQGTIDPPPHDSAYFAYKLQFLSNYFRKVSNGKMNIRGEVFGHVITLSKSLGSYSPPKDGSNDKPLADLVVESWHKADSLYPSIQFNKYDAFIIFHAGVGRDINLVATLGFDPAPFDIPSLTFNLRTLRNYLHDQGFAGIPVNHGAILITNTMVLPETESRPLVSGASIDTLHGSINGLLANSFGSYLGLPDLFDTKTGASGIGEFGLMDIAGSFVFYEGLFPPEPCAWEKIYLGWVTPITLPPGTSTVSLPAVGLKTGRDTVYKIPITDHEYFLIENRSRDPQQNGQTLTLRQKGGIVTRYFPQDTTGFSFDNVSLISGSVIDVEDFDWALPSLTTVTDSSYFGGGILIWHIDEDVIAQGLSDNTVNADPSHRGVSVEEADGSQDLGQAYDAFTDLGSGTEWGFQLDFWYSGNPSPVYKNVFDKDSHPNSRSNTGAMSLVTIGSFGKRAPRMAATVDIGDTQVHRIPGFTRTLPAKINVTPPTALTSSVLVGVDGKIYAFNADGTSKTKDPSGLVFPKGGSFSLAATNLGTNTLIAGSQDSTVYLVSAFDGNGDGIIDSASSTAMLLGEPVTTPAMFADLSVTPSLVVGSAHGTVWSFSYTGALQKKTVVSTSAVNSLTQLPTPSLSKPYELFFTCGGRLYGEQGSVALGDSALPWISAAVANHAGNFVVVGQLGGKRLLAFSRDLSQKVFDVVISQGSISTLAAADIDGDGEKDVVVMAGGWTYAYNRIGVLLEGFPLVPPGSKTFVGNPVIVDLDGNGKSVVFASLSTGEVAAYDREGHPLDGFPVQFGPTGEMALALFQSRAGNYALAGLTTAGTFQALEFTTKVFNVQNIAWSQPLKDSRHSNYDGSVGGTNPLPSEFLPHSRVYNWPNPVLSSTTQIRYYTPEDATVSIKIFDLAGVKIAELSAQSKGGLDGEVSWDVSHVQSGVYLARVEATGSSRSEVAIIKIAVVK